MALQFGDRVKETTSTTGTGTIDLDGAASGYQSFAAEIISGNTTKYLIVDDPDNPSEWEVGEGTFTSGTPDTLSRDMVEDSSNGGATVSFTAGTKTVISTLTAGDLVLVGANNTFTGNNDFSGGTTTLGAVAGTFTGSPTINWTGTYGGTNDFTGAEQNFADITVNAIWTDSATGGDQGADTINASKLYDDGKQIHALQDGLDTVVDLSTGSPTAADFTSIRSDARRITIMLEGVSTNGTSLPIVQIGDSGGLETSGYSGAAINLRAGFGSSDDTAMSDGFLVNGEHAAGVVYHGKMELVLQDSANNKWVATAQFGRSDNTIIALSGGSKALSATLDRVRLTTQNGTDTFDAGSVNIVVE